MSRAEEKALEAYKNEPCNKDTQNKVDGYIEGYNQSLKDIWHNVKDETPIDGERLLLINRNGEYGTTMLMMPILHKEFRNWEKWAYIKDLIPSE